MELLRRFMPPRRMYFFSLADLAIFVCEVRAYIWMDALNEVITG